ncbi:MAG: hypothetical protein K6G42_08875 [Lachnospiraceae bacterium]|nr:hypothetical protein [Lachnospiraceae bacterium]
MALSNIMTKSLISASSSMEQVKAQHAIKTQMERKAGVLDTEIKLDSGRGGDAAKKKEDLEDIQKKATEIGQQEMSRLSELNSNMNEAAMADAEEQKQNERVEKQRDKKRAERKEQAEKVQEQLARKASGNGQVTGEGKEEKVLGENKKEKIPGEGEERQITVAGVAVYTKSASEHNTGGPHIDERVAATTPAEVSLSSFVDHNMDVRT